MTASAGSEAAAQGSRQQSGASTLAIWTALVTVYLVWGSTYLAIRIVVETVPPLLAMGARFLVAGCLLAAFLLVRRGRAALRVTRRALGGAAVVGVLLLFCGNGGVAVAEQTVPSGFTALLVAATPLFLVVLRRIAGDRPSVLSLVGTMVGFVGIVVLVRPGADVVSGETVASWGPYVVLLAAAGWAGGSFAAGHLTVPSDAFVATTWEMLLGGGVMTLAAVAAGELADLHLATIPPEAWAWLGYLVVVGSLVAFSAYVWLLHHAPISLTATYAYVNPVVAVLLGALVLDEPITAAVIAGGSIVVVGVGLVVSAERPRRALRRRAPTEQPEVVDLRP